MNEPVCLTAVANDRRSAEAKEVRGALFAQCRAILDELGDDVSGFAFVVWTRDGDIRSGFDTGYGPVRPALIPTLTSDALNRHVAVTLAPAVSATS